MTGLPSSSLAWNCNDPCSCTTSAGGNNPHGNGPRAGNNLHDASAPQKKNSSDPINLGRMSIYLWDTDSEVLMVPGGQMAAALRFTRFYSSDDNQGGSSIDGPLGWNWTHNYHVRLTATANAATVRTETLTEEVFTLNGGAYESLSGQSRLTKVGTNFIWQLANGTRYSFDGTNANRLAAIVDPLTNTLTLTYNGSQQLTNVADQLGRSLRLTYNGSGKLAQVVDALNRTNTYLYSASGQLTNVTDGLGLRAGYAYDWPGSGRITAITDPRGNPHIYGYDTANKVNAETNAVGAVMSFNRDDVTATVIVTDRNGNSYTNRFNSMARLTNRADAAGSVSYLLDEKNRATNIINRLGHHTRHVYAGTSCGCEIAGALVMTVDALNRTNRWEHETNYHRPIAFTNALGHVTRWQYDPRGNLTNTLDALGANTRQIFDAAGNRTQIIDALNRTNRFAYDLFGNLTNRVDPLGNSIRFRYDLAGQPTNRVDALNRTNQAFYDARQRVTRTVDPLGGVVAFAHDGNGNLTARTNELGQATRYTYDAANQLSTILLPGTNTPFISYTYDPNGNRVAETNALGQRAAYGYDALNRLTAITNPLNQVWSHSYDAESRLTASTDPNNRTTRFAYDAGNQLTALTNALNQVIQFGYDLTGNRTNITDARGNSLGFRYDAVDRLTNLVYAANDLEQFQYDAVGNLTNYVTRSGDGLEMKYDAANRLVSKIFQNGNPDDPASFFEYDAAHRLTRAVSGTDQGASTNTVMQFAYDAAGRLTNESQQVWGITGSVGYGYDAAGKRTRLTYPDGTFITYEYNTNGWLTAIKDGGTNDIVTYAYDAAGRRVLRTLQNYTFTVYGYDAAGQMTNLWHYKAVSGVTNTISQFSYGYDGAGNRTWVKRANGKGDVYQYDPTDQLTNVLYEATNPDATPSAWTNEVRYVFDAAGNRTSVTRTNSGTTSYGANALNQYTNVGGFTPGYDANGNLETDGSGWNYDYDSDNKLRWASSSTLSVDYIYDAFGRLSVSSSSAGVTRRYYYDDQWRVIAEDDGTGTLTAKYVYGPEIDEPVRLTRNGNRYFYHQAALGTVTELTGFLGNVRESYTYDVYGEPTIRNNVGTVIASSQFGNRFLFQGRDRDPDTGLYNFRNRWYSPTLGRFLQTDPIREEGGLNLYRFAENNPICKADPFGQISTVEVIVVLIGAGLFLMYLIDWKTCADLVGKFGDNVRACQAEGAACGDDNDKLLRFLEKYNAGMGGYNQAVLNCAIAKDPAAYKKLVAKCGAASANGLVNGTLPTK